jgi:hypothetical protein
MMDICREHGNEWIAGCPDCGLAHAEADARAKAAFIERVIGTARLFTAHLAGDPERAWEIECFIEDAFALAKRFEERASKEREA